MLNPLCVDMYLHSKVRVMARNNSEGSDKKVSMIRKYHNHKLQTNPWHLRINFKKSSVEESKSYFIARGKVLFILTVHFESVEYVSCYHIHFQFTGTLSFHRDIKIQFTEITQNMRTTVANLALKAPITTKVICFCHLLKCLRSLYGKQEQSVLGPRCLLLYLIRQ